MSKPKIIAARPAGLNSRGQDHQVVTMTGGGQQYRRKPCPTCPWRKDAVGEFPAEAFRHSANTAYDMSPNTFACHSSGQKRPATCAGFLLSHSADHNLAVRLGLRSGRFKQDVEAGGCDLFPTYREMAVANGVAEDDPVLGPCR